MNDKNKPPEDGSPKFSKPLSPGNERKTFNINNPFGIPDQDENPVFPINKDQVTASGVSAAGLNRFTPTSYFQQFNEPEKPEKLQSPELPEVFLSTYLKKLLNETKEKDKGENSK